MAVFGNRYWQIAPLSISAVAAICLLSARPASAYDQNLADQARATLHRAALYFSTKLAVHGTYVWAYSEDLAARKGEGHAGPTVGWVQPPGTPAVGAALLRIYEATGDETWLDAAKASGKALVETQLISGGWYYSIEMDKRARSKWCYRSSGISSQGCSAISENRAKNRTTLNDNTTQSALLFLIWLDEETESKDGTISSAVSYGLTGCRWRDVPPAYGPPTTVYNRYHR